MISQLTGTIVTKKSNKVVIDVCGVGYELTVSLSTFAELPTETSKTRIFVYQHIRENAIELFGFSTQFEKELFLLLIGVSGVGPKTAMDILSNTSLSGFKKAILSSDIKTISSIRGIGKKTAEKLAFELKDKIKEFQIPGGKIFVEETFLNDAIEALKSLGFTYIQAKEAAEESARVIGKNASTQEIVKQSLKGLGGRG